ncbi:vWA domain-containing protein [Tsukamurella soli]|uniref:VWFA domain-containing protein n=1 Tax=Tsukamurella soli TaxID=644556 RepID=A0ABP8KHT0_9ACTN
MTNPPGPTRAGDFEVEVFQNEYLTVGATEVDAIVTVPAHGGPGAPGRAAGLPDAAEVITVDTSGSMGQPITKLTAAKPATAATIDTLRDGVEFAVVAGNHMARSVYPRHGLATAGPRTRAAAEEELRHLVAGGSTAISQWLLHADTLLAQSRANLKHAILLTDGRNEHEAPEQLESVLRALSAGSWATAAVSEPIGP